MAKMKLAGCDGESYVNLNIKNHYQSHKECSHRRVMCDESFNDLECEDCGNKINPIWWIVTKWRDIEGRRRHAAAIRKSNIALKNKMRQEDKVGRKSYKTLWELANKELAAKTLQLDNIKASLPNGKWGTD